MRVLPITLAASMALVATARAEPYNVNLASKDVYWGSVLSNDRLPYIDGEGIVSSGPFFIDVNHREGALLIGPLVVWANGHRSESPEQVPLGAVDLRNTRIRVNVKLAYAPWKNEFDPRQGGKLVLWFQSMLDRGAVAGGPYEMPWRAANYVYNKSIRFDSDESVDIDVTPDLNQWTCLGRNPIDTRPLIGSAAKYTCALNQKEFAQAMSHPADMGILFLLPPKAPDGSPIAWLDPKVPNLTPILGNARFVLKEFTILRPQTVMHE